MRHSSFHTILTLSLSLLLSTAASAQWNSFIRNYNSNEYGKGAQMWDIEPYDQSWTFFANQNGMLQFDGMKWDVLPLHASQYVRSLLSLPDEGRIYVGGINEFGYFMPLDNGHLQYICMSDSLPVEVRSIGNIWNISHLTSGIYFQGDNKIVRCYNGKHSLIDAHLKIECSLMLNDVLYIGTERGIYIIAGNDIFPMKGAELLADKRIRCMARYKHGFLIATENGDVFFSDNKIIRPFDTQASTLLKHTGIFCIASSDHYIAFGTIQNGIILIDDTSGEVSLFNESNGLQNNTVLSLAFDKIGNLWAGLDKGTDYIYLNIPFTNLYNKMYSCGTGYAVMQDADRLLFGTNRGLYYAKPDAAFKVNPRKLKLINNTEGQVWGLTKIDDDILCLHDRGVMVINDTTAHHIKGITGAWDCQAIHNHDGLYYVGTYDGLYIIEKVNGQWIVKNRVDGTDNSFQNYLQESATSIWLHMGNDASVICLTISDDLKKLTGERIYDKNDGLPDCRIFDIETIASRIYCTTEKGIYKFNHHTKRFEPANEFQMSLGANKSILRLINYNDRLIAAVSRDEISVATSKLNSFVSLYKFSIQQSLISLVDNFTNIVPIADSLFILPTDNGFALINPKKSTANPKHYHSFRIKQVSLTNNRDSVVYYDNFIGTKPQLDIEYKENSIRFEYGATAICSPNILYSTRMNDGDWSEPSHVTNKEYSDLKEGHYKFDVRATFNNGEEIIESFHFNILPPWYRSIWAYIVYSIIGIILIYIVGNIENKRLRNREQRITMAKDKEMLSQQKLFEEEKEQRERHIMELEKEKLEYDLKHKSQEMANLMINIVRKNEMLNDIKDNLTKVMSSIKSGDTKDGYRQLLEINGKIDQNMNDDELLKRIEEQFDLVHNNFIKKLSERHPDLSNNERMMCAYLKMNLSTKEIAPLLNISVRGVETMRYRLRKKLGLEREDGLMTYFNEQFK